MLLEKDTFIYGGWKVLSDKSNEAEKSTDAMQYKILF